MRSDSHSPHRLHVCSRSVCPCVVSCQRTCLLKIAALVDRTACWRAWWRSDFGGKLMCGRSGHDNRRHECLCKLSRLETWWRRLSYRICSLWLFFLWLCLCSRISAGGRRGGCALRNAKVYIAFRGLETTFNFNAQSPRVDTYHTPLHRIISTRNRSCPRRISDTTCKSCIVWYRRQVRKALPNPSMIHQPRIAVDAGKQPSSGSYSGITLGGHT